MLALSETDFLNAPLTNWQSFSGSFAAPNVYFPPINFGGFGGGTGLSGTDLGTFAPPPIPTQAAPDNDDSGCGIFGCDPFGYGKGCGIFGCNPLTDSGYLGITEIVRKYSLLFIATALVLLGVYLMTKSAAPTISLKL